MLVPGTCRPWAYRAVSLIIIGNINEKIKRKRIFIEDDHIFGNTLYYEDMELKNPLTCMFSKKEAVLRAEKYMKESPLFSDGTRPFCIIAKANSKYAVFSSNTCENAHLVTINTEKTI